MTTRCYYVYVVELRVPSQRVPEFYVGSSAFTPAERLRRHRGAGDRRASSSSVARYGVRLRPDLYAGLNAPPMRTREEAKRAEVRLADRLERQGKIVRGACGRRCPLG